MTGRILTTIAPAKINLFLEVLARRSDGYHELETVMTGVDLCDHLSAGPVADGNIHLSVRCRRRFSADFDVPPGDDNLVFQAVRRFRELAGIDQGIHIQLVKSIPVQAGLGGASSDAAAALQLVNRFWQVNWPTERLREIAAELGSDIPFFLYSSPAVCQGRGERVTPISNVHHPAVVIAKPPVGLPTSQIFSVLEVPKDPRPIEHTVRALRGSNFRHVLATLFNRLETAAGQVTDWVQWLRDAFAKVGCPGHQLSGSGSCYFGLFPTISTANRAATVLRSRHPDVQIFCTRLLNFWSSRQRWTTCEGVLP